MTPSPDVEYVATLSLPIGPDEIHVFVGVTSLVNDAVDSHQLVGDVVVLLVDDTVLTVPVRVSDITADDDPTAPLDTVVGLVENKATSTYTMRS